MLDSHFYAVPFDGGYTWTLASWTGRILAEVENRYGPRNKNWTFLGVEFSDAGPQIWYPGNRENVVIQLSSSATDDHVQAIYQLSHECVHLLAPGGSMEGPVLEEGVATVFAEDFVTNQILEGRLVPLTDDIRYVEAARLVRELQSVHPDAIKRMRDIEPAMKRMTAVTFELAGLDRVSPALRDSLLRPFLYEDRHSE